MLYTEAYVSVLLKRFLPSRQNMIALAYTQVKLLKSINLQECSTLSVDYRTKTTRAFAVEVSVCKQVIHSSKYSLDIPPKMEHNQLQKYLYFFSKHLPFSAFTSSTPKTQIAKNGEREKILTFFKHRSVSLFFLFSPDTLSTRDPLLIRCNPSPYDTSHILCFYKELKRKSFKFKQLQRNLGEQKAIWYKLVISCMESVKS